MHLHRRYDKWGMYGALFPCWGQQHPREIHALPHHHQLAASRASSLWTHGHNPSCSSVSADVFPRVAKVAITPRKTLMGCH